MVHIINWKVCFSGLEWVGELDDVPGNMRRRPAGGGSPLQGQGEISGRFSSLLQLTHYSAQIVRYETNSSKDSGTMALLVDYLPIIHH